MKRLSLILKTSRFLYALYFYTMSSLIKFLGLLVGFDKKLILFNCFGGRKYDDNPKAIYERVLQDKRFNDYKLVWAVHDPAKVKIPGRARVIKTDGFTYFRTALRAKVWITNSSMERGLSFKKKKTVCLNSWHGTAIKVMGTDLREENSSFNSKAPIRADIMLAQGQYDIDVFSRCFQLPKSSFKLTGSPRNDVITKHTETQIADIKEKLGIDKSKIVILYAPTFREYCRGTANEVVMNIPISLERWQETLGTQFVVLFRVHYEVAKHMNIDGFPLFIDVSSYPIMNDLMIVSDVLISDYSSVFFDYSIMHKPMYCFAYDYEEYLSKRGLYLNLKEEFFKSFCDDEEELIKELLDYQSKKEELIIEAEKFQKRYVTEYGHASEKCCDELALVLNE